MTHQMSSAMFRAIAGVCRTMVVANTGGSLALLIIFMLGGFIIPRTQIKPWWIWGYWCSPLSYAESSITVNEFLAPRWAKQDGKHTLGQQILINSGVFPKNYWYWIGIAALMGYVLLFNTMYTFVLTYLNPLGKPQAIISKDALAAKEANLEGVEVSLPSRARSKSRKSLSRSLSSTAEGAVGSRKSITVRESFTENGGGEVQMQDRNGAGDRVSSVSFASDASDAVAGVEPKRGMILPFQRLAISFDDIKYYVDMPAEMKKQGVAEDRLQLLCGITGAFRPGVLTALVGVSGAGKTTLMDVLAGRKTGGYIEGDIRISGFPKNQATFARISGYCEQNDIHSPQVTVRESVTYSAWLRLPAEIDKETREQFVDEVMDLVELTPLENALVGLPGVTGLSTEQRKRLTIAVELVANPSIIFMDEPTSGLDARAAAIVMRTVRNTVDTGRTVVCTIHQPSIDIFEAFDEMLLMKRGGQVIYMGPLGRHSHRLIEYFEAIPGVPKIRQDYNPATWMLEVSSVSIENQLGIDFAEIYSKSALFQRNKSLVAELSVPPPGSKDLHFPTTYSQPFFTQIIACFWKQWWTYWRSPDYNLVRLTFTFVAAILFGTIFWDLGKKTSKQSNLFSVMGSMYGAVLFIGVNNASTVQPVVAIERTIFYRERAAGMYSAIPYAIAQVLIELPYCLVQTIIYALITYSMINFTWTAPKFFYYMFIMFFSLLYFTYYGMMAVALTPNHQIAAIVASGFYSLFNLFSGFLIFRPKIPKWWVWYYWICPVAWTLYGLIITQFGDVTSDVYPTGGGNGMTVQAYLSETFGFHHKLLGLAVAMPVVFTILFASVFAFGIKFLNFQQR
jgi:ABC-type multidrug transport system ATPase subunit/ABC-type multidrug transport system permease subunit